MKKKNVPFKTYSFNLVQIPNRNTILIITIMAERQSAALDFINKHWHIKPEFEWQDSTALHTPIEGPLTLDRG